MIYVIVAGAIAFPFMLIPLSQKIEYYCDCKKYGKEIANELAVRF